jgi:hypothetical protein
MPTACRWGSGGGWKCDVVKTGTDITPEKPNQHWFDDQWLKIFGDKINASNKMNSFIPNMPYLNFHTNAKILLHVSVQGHERNKRMNGKLK